MRGKWFARESDNDRHKHQERDMEISQQERDTEILQEHSAQDFKTREKQRRKPKPKNAYPVSGPCPQKATMLAAVFTPRSLEATEVPTHGSHISAGHFTLSQAV